ncbi:N-acetylmuramoyl-L-alanine amidase [Weizmannia acidilactici]|uniref:N-acetylmuramoyl-L-alanine amidase n=1 Tax=Weizmannia acidilactici TaxID=2607726 RepID=UPI00124F0FD9|nr:N-acetylmuramoyl-L-alanine amidase [Weizmannia acidilactici]GER67487.1 N-acetylmuramoyl-L-alanine amidase [Weizmannia acidilactici]
MAKARRILLLSAVAFLISLCALPQPNERAYAATSLGQYQVTATALYMRKGPSKNYSSIALLKKGTKVTVYSIKNGWAYISYGGKKGYASSQYLKKVAAASLGTYTVTATSLYMRKGPGKNYGTIALLKKGTKVTVYSIKNSWAYIQYGSKKGYASSKYLKKYTKTGSTASSSGTTGSTTPSTGSSSYQYEVVTASALNLRKSPGSGSTILKVLYYGDKVKVYSVSNGWAYVAYGTAKGYVSASYLLNLNGKTICIDAGHGGSDPGASGKLNGSTIYEKTINLAVALKVQSLLQNSGLKTVMTRTGDTYPTLSQRVSIAKNAKANLFISIHSNTSSSSSAYGVETFYPNNNNGTASRVTNSIKLASYVQARVAAAMGYASGYGNRGYFYKDLHVLRENTMPAILVELGFLSNSTDLKKLASATYQSKNAQAIYDGIIDYYKKN